MLYFLGLGIDFIMSFFPALSGWVVVHSFVRRTRNLVYYDGLSLLTLCVSLDIILNFLIFAPSPHVLVHETYACLHYIYFSFDFLVFC